MEPCAETRYHHPTIRGRVVAPSPDASPDVPNRQRRPGTRCTSAEPEYRWKSSHPSELDLPRTRSSERSTRNTFYPPRAASRRCAPLFPGALPGNGTPDPLYPEPPPSVFMRRTISAGNPTPYTLNPKP